MVKFIMLTNALNNEEMIVQVGAIAYMRPWTIDMPGEESHERDCTLLMLTTGTTGDQLPNINDNTIEAVEDIKQILHKMQHECLEV